MSSHEFHIVSFITQGNNMELQGNRSFRIFAKQLFRMETQFEHVWTGFEQIVLNQVTAAIHMTHFVKNLGDKLVDVHSVGQNKVCAENNRSHKETKAGT